jgi:DNA-binding MarR family transcriptional regulator
MTEHRSIGKSISYLARSLGRYIDTETAHLKLSNAAVPFITYLYEHDGVHQDELAEQLHYDKSSAARAVSSLEKHGYVTRTTDQSNKRRNVIRTTPEAHKIKPELYKLLQETTVKLFEGFSAEETNQYFRLTKLITQNAAGMLEKQK